MTDIAAHPETLIPLVFLSALAFFIYFFPAIAAHRRGACKNPQSVLVVNLFFGWTFIGWVIALAMAYSGRESAQL
jgi:membrane-bound acyltransferase YfiQ involved in biofilm formation